MQDDLTPSPQAADEPSASAKDDAAQKAEEYLAGWKRAQADYQNLKRDIERERSEFTKYANERLIERLLPAIDQFELAIKYLPDLSKVQEDARRPIENWIVGVKAVQALWEHIASDTSLERIPTNGPFDPILHEAAGEREAEGVPSGHVAEVLQNGWKLHGKVLRPARVILAK